MLAKSQVAALLLMSGHCIDEVSETFMIAECPNIITSSWLQYVKCLTYLSSSSLRVILLKCLRLLLRYSLAFVKRFFNILSMSLAFLRFQISLGVFLANIHSFSILNSSAIFFTNQSVILSLADRNADSKRFLTCAQQSTLLSFLLPLVRSS